MRKVVLTSDIDWAPEEVIQDFLDLLQSFNAKCTLFCTHESEVISKCNSKLFKQGGIKEVIQQAQLCHLLGIKVVLGNGVATKLSNQIENQIYSSFPFFYGASEANGFLKVKENG